MGTSARRCAGCGGPLPETPVSQRQVTCGFCGIVNDLAHAQTHATPTPVAVNVDLEGMTRAASGVVRNIMIAVCAIALIVSVSVAWGIFSAVGPVTDAVRTVAREAGALASLVKPTTIPPGELASTEGAGWRELAVPAPATVWTEFDPIQNLPWALNIARAWQPDAQVTRIDVARLTPAGVVNVSSGPNDTVGYRFVSPAKAEEWGRQADRGVASDRGGHELMLRVADQKTVALVSPGRPSRRDVAPPPVDAKPFGVLLTAAQRQKQFTAFPLYNGYLIHLEREGWVLYLQSLSQRETLPRIRGRDGAVFPYRR